MQASMVDSETKRINSEKVRIIACGAIAREVLAITTLDGRPVGKGVPGPMFRRMYALFQDLKRASGASQ